MGRAGGYHTVHNESLAAGAGVGGNLIKNVYGTKSRKLFMN